MSGPNPISVPMPRLQAALVNPDGSITFPWQRLLISMWTALGGSRISPPNSVYLQQVGDQIVAFSSATGQEIGVVDTGGGTGLPPVVIGPVMSPFVFGATGPGTLMVNGGKVEISRPPAPYYPIGNAGGAIPMLVGDLVRITWFGVSPPATTFFPL